MKMMMNVFMSAILVLGGKCIPAQADELSNFVVDRPELIIDGAISKDNHFLGPIGIQGRFTNDFDDRKEAYYTLKAHSEPNWISAVKSPASVTAKVGDGPLNYHSNPSSFSDNRFIVVSEKNGDIYYRTFKADGSAVNPPRPLLRNKGFDPRVVVLPDQTFLVFWRQVPRNICVFGNRVVGTGCRFGDIAEIHGQRFDRNGTLLGDPIGVNAGRLITAKNFELVSLRNGGFVVIWESVQNLQYSLYAQFFNSSGQPVGNGKSFPVNSEPSISKTEAAATVLENGQLVIVWRNHHLNQNKSLYLQRYDPDGSKNSEGILQVNTHPIVGSSLPDIARLKGGGFVVAWQNKVREANCRDSSVPNRKYLCEDGTNYGIFGRRFSGNHFVEAAEFRINKNARHDQTQPRITGLHGARGGFVATWQGDSETTFSQEIFARLFDSAGNPVDPDRNIQAEFLVNAVTSGEQGDPAIVGQRAKDSAKDAFIVSWKNIRTGSMTIKKMYASASGIDTGHSPETVFHRPNQGYAENRGLTVLPGGGVYTPISQIAGSQFVFFPFKRTLKVENLAPNRNIAVQMKVVDPRNGNHKLSPIRDYFHRSKP